MVTSYMNGTIFYFTMKFMQKNVVLLYFSSVEVLLYVSSWII